MPSAGLTSAGGITGFHLKLIAVVSMFLDHFGAVILHDLILAGREGGGETLVLVFAAEHQSFLMSCYTLLRAVGRLAFPLFCFLLVQGFLHTGSRGAYLRRLFLFALLSEIPFDLAFHRCLLEFRGSNVFFTLALGLLLLWLVEETGRMEPPAVRLGAVVLLTALFCGLAERVFVSDYGAQGVLGILILYLLRGYPAAAQTLCTLLLADFGKNTLQLYGLGTVPLVAAYNGTRGPSLKYLFYLFYPLHLLLLTGLSVWLSGTPLSLGF